MQEFDGSDNSNGSTDDEEALMSKKFKLMMKKKEKFQHSSRWKDSRFQKKNEEQIADIFTKALDANQFEKLRGKLGICLLEEL